MLWQLPWEMHGLVRSPLGHHYNAPDLLHLGVIGRAHSVEVTCNLGTQTTALEAQERPPCNRVRVGGPCPLFLRRPSLGWQVLTRGEHHGFVQC